MNRLAKAVLPVVVLCAGMVLVTGCAPGGGILIKPVSANQELKESTVSSDSGYFLDKIALIDVDGLILDAREEGLFGNGENPTSLFVEKLKKANEDDSVKAVILRINSPGGGVTASNIMYESLKKFRGEKKVPCIAIIEDVGASARTMSPAGPTRSWRTRPRWWVPSA